ncbi:MAG: T9SS type A sorting domain-containing protein [Ignavibacteriaceae bacterium]|jgi:hypothetical protein
MKTTLLFSSLLLFTALTFAQVRFVSKTGSSTPPYTSWATASDSIQKCINVCNDGDTVVVANGVYKEFLITKAAITLLGSSMDSCVIDGTGLGVYYTVEAKKDITLAGFKIIGKGVSTGMWNSVVASLGYNVNINACIITNANVGVDVTSSSGRIENLLIKDVEIGVHTFCAYDTCKPVISNCLIHLRHDQGNSLMGIDNYHNGQPTVDNNIILGPPKEAYEGISNIIFLKNMKVRGNLIAGFFINIDVAAVTDTAVIVNNTLLDYQLGNSSTLGSIWFAGDNTYLRNNIIANSYIGIRVEGSPNTDYNLFWNNSADATDARGIGAHDIFADPMFVKDTIAYSGKGDFHLQKYSSAIDAGDPSILDKDGSRSDIGMYGGILGSLYTYLDLAPKAPGGLTLKADSGKIYLIWKKNSEADFKQYRIFRDTVPNFNADSTTFITTTTDTSYTHLIPVQIDKFYYKLTAVDTSMNESEVSEEAGINLTSIGNEWNVVYSYRLYQNYPNPFNPKTIISYRLKEKGLVKITIYDIKGELIQSLVNAEQTAGYYEVPFNGEYLSSGIYLYRIEALGEGKIPRYMEMKKMLLIK